MKRFVVKTAVITLIAVLLSIIVAITLLSVTSPRLVSNIFYNMGNDLFASRFMELSYQKSGSREDLVKLVSRASEAEDYPRVEKYACEMLGREDFAEICEENGGDYDEYVYGVLAVAMYENEKPAADIFKQCDLTVKDGYLEGNAYQVLLYHSASKGDKQFIGLLRAAIENFPQTEHLKADLGFIDEILK